MVATIGDGSFQYSVQAIWTAAQHDLPIVFVVMRNEEYSILKAFALLEKTPGVPGMDLPGLDIVSIATGFGCRAVHADTTEQLAEQFTTALTAQGPSVIVVQTANDGPPWLGRVQSSSLTRQKLGSVFRSKGFYLRYEHCLGLLVEWGWRCCPRRHGNANFFEKLFLPAGEHRHSSRGLIAGPMRSRSVAIRNGAITCRRS